jgi:hypothetical protein
MYRCYENVETQDWRLVADERIQCSSTFGVNTWTPWVWVIRAHCFFAVWVVGVGLPLWIFRRTRSHLKRRDDSMRSSVPDRCTSAFSDPYKDRFHYFQGERRWPRGGRTSDASGGMIWRQRRSNQLFSCARAKRS